MDERELRYWIRLSRLELSARAAIALIEHFGGPEAVFEASESELASVEQLTEKGRAKVLGPMPAAVERDLKVIDQMGVVVTPCNSRTTLRA